MKNISSSQFFLNCIIYIKNYITVFSRDTFKNDKKGLRFGNNFILKN